MQSVVKEFINNLFLILGYLGGFYFAFHFGVTGKKKKIPVVTRVIMALIAIALAVVVFFLMPAILDTINKNINVFINKFITKNINIFRLTILIANACLAFYLLLNDFKKKSGALERPVHLIISFSLSSCLILYACVGFFPLIPANSKEFFHNSHFIILLTMLVTLILYAVWRPDKKKLGRNKIFISYRRKDSADITGRIVDRLIVKFGSSNILRDVDSIPLGVNFADYIDKLLENSAVCLVVIGKKWVSLCNNNRSDKTNQDSPDFVQIEIETALAHRLPIIPVLLQNTPVPSKTQLPKSIEAISFQNGIAIRPDPDFNMDIQRLIHGIKAGIRKTKKMRKIYGYQKMMKARVPVKSGAKSKIKSKTK